MSKHAIVDGWRRLPWSPLQQLTGPLADGTWVPMATMHFTAMTAALLAGWMAVRAKA